MFGFEILSIKPNRTQTSVDTNGNMLFGFNEVWIIILT
jgi:hypothetical protein